ncbi:hypothetical protein [Tenacibaculum maritimum]|uniref:hypothetical protein n=1 Tax=Tenacibaculum maritimum TaxID=107401 RepID=UPI0012E44743|nr:hypothetical protein [Tenacibaculum maritimum]CAA0249998.1 hypothetical protein TMP227_700006 [Tenacibaculum maritimum]
MQIITLIIISIFTEPFIGSFREYDNYLQANIYVKGKECGNLSITSTHINYRLFCGINVKKGLLKLEDAILEYSKGKLLVVNSKYSSEKTILKIKCKKDIYDKILIYYKKVKSN